MKLRTLTTAMVLLSAGTAIGATTQHVVSAGTSSGDRPVFVQIEPCRLIDTRGDTSGGPRTSPLGPGEVATFDVAGPGSECAGRIPADAVAISTNMTALNATAATFITVWAAGARPTVSSLNPRPGSPPTPNAVSADITDDGRFNVYNDAGSVGLLIDVGGYYVAHDHDDRYYTEDELDALLPPAEPSEFVQPHVLDLIPDGDWVFDNFSWGSPAVEEKCLRTPLDIPEGMMVESVAVTYAAATSVSAEIYVVGVRNTPGPLGDEELLFHHLSFDDLPDTDSEAELLATVTLEHNATDPVEQALFAGDDYDQVFGFCTPGIVTIQSLRVNVL